MSRGNTGYRERDGLGWTTGTPPIGKAERYWNAIRKEEEAKAALTETIQSPITLNPEKQMNWKKTRITLNVWQDGNFRITENPEADADEMNASARTYSVAVPTPSISRRSTPPSAPPRH